MAQYNTSGIVKDGLVFNYDMYNSQSWRGEPVTNQFNCPNPYDVNNNVTFSIQGTGTFQRVYSGTYGGYTIKPTDVVYRYNLGSGGCHYHGNSAAISAGQYVCYSVDYYISPDASDYPTNSSLVVLENYSGSALGGGTVVGASTVMGKWQTIKGYAGPTGGTGTQAMFLYPGGCSSTYMASRGFILMKNPMFEFRSDVKYNPFVNTSRLTNNNLESVPSGPTWNQSASSASGGTLTFANGSYTNKGTWDLYKTYSSLTSNVNYTWSALVKLGTASNLLVTMNNTQSWDTGPSRIFDQSFGLSTDKWTRVSITGTTNTGSFNLHLGSTYNVGVSGTYRTADRDTVQTGGTVYIKDVRLVKDDTQPVLEDLTGQNGIIVNGLTYNSDGSLSFLNNSGFYIPSIDFSQAQTIEIWLKPEENDGARRNPYNQAYGGYGTWTHETDGTINYFYGDAGNNGSPYIGHTSSFTVAQNEVACVCTTRDTSTSWWYKNGVQYNSYGHGYGTLTGDSNNITIGNGYAGGYYGKIYAVKLYNRALSAEEVQQNFNAVRGRYGI